MLALICVAGILLRLAVCWQLAGANGGRNSVLAPSAATDLRTYMELSDAVLASGWPETAFDYQPFYYTIFLPVVKAAGNISGCGVWGVILAQCLLGGVVILLAGNAPADAVGTGADWLPQYCVPYPSRLCFIRLFTLL
jgi:hypothetical protein